MIGARPAHAAWGFSRADLTDMRLGARSWSNISECIRSALLNLYENAVRLDDTQKSFSDSEARRSDFLRAIESRTQSRFMYSLRETLRR